jgi:NB-ARC domain
LEGVGTGLGWGRTLKSAAGLSIEEESEMDDLYMYSRKDSLTPTGYTAIEPQPQDVRLRRSASETRPEAAPRPQPLYRCMAPGPNGFVRRGELERLIEALAGAAGTAGVAGVAAVALVGPEGFGKTILAQAACWDSRVRSAFPDGTLWMALSAGSGARGRLARLREVIRWWTRTEPPAFATEGAAVAHLSPLLAGRRVLLVLDGAASAAELKPFQELPSGVVLLVTARDSSLIPEAAQRIAIGPMAPQEAVNLLRAGLPRSFEGTFQALAHRLGRWPLLLAIVNRQIREWNVKSQSLLESALRSVVGPLGTLDLEAGFGREARRDAVRQVVAMALRSLSGEDRDRLLDLAVFPVAADVPLPVVRRLLGLGAGEAKKLGKRLNDLSLVALDPWTGTLRLHAVIGDFLLERRRGELSLLHGRLLDSCHPASGRWADLPAGEPYLWLHLAHHFLAAGWRGELRDTLLDLSFLRARLQVTDVHSLIADFDLAGDDPELNLVREALRLSAGALASDPAQLESQLLGRLLDRRERDLQPLLSAAHAWRNTAWLKPQTASFVRPGAASEDAPAGVPFAPRSKAATTAVRGFLAVAADGPMLRVLTLETGLRTLTGHTGTITALAILNARRVVSAALDSTLRLWDLDRGEPLAVLHLDAPVRTLTAGPDGRTLAARDDAGRTHLLELVEPE